MHTVKCLLFDEKNKKKVEVTLIVNNEGNSSLSMNPNYVFNFSNVAVSPRIKNSTRFLTLPNGNLLETIDNDAVDELISLFNSSNHGNIEKEKWLIRLSILIFFIIVSWYVVHILFPSLGHKASMAVPVEILNESGKKAISNLDKEVFKKSILPETDKTKIIEIFNSLIPQNDNGFSYKLHFYQSNIVGANAFAMPSGDIILTDELVNISSNENELISVLLHEIAHVELRHATQSMIHTSSILLLTIAITGDVTSLSTLLVGVPALLLNSSYNRKMEWDADTYAINRMKKLGINPIFFTRVLEKMLSFHDSKKKSDSKSVGYWSSHPSSEKRIQRFQNESIHFINK